MNVSNIFMLGGMAERHTQKYLMFKSAGQESVPGQ